MAGLARCVRAPGPCRPHEIAIRSGHRPGAGWYAFAIGRDAHAAAWLAPVKARGFEHSIETFAFGFTFDADGTRHHPGGYFRRNLPTLDEGSGGAQVAESVNSRTSQ